MDDIDDSGLVDSVPLDPRECRDEENARRAVRVSEPLPGTKLDSGFDSSRAEIRSERAEPDTERSTFMEYRLCIAIRAPISGARHQGHVQHPCGDWQQTENDNAGMNVGIDNEERSGLTDVFREFGTF